MFTLVLIIGLTIVLVTGVVVNTTMKAYDQGWRPSTSSFRPPRKLPQEYVEPIQKYFSYYHWLTDHQKQVFLHRVALFIQSKKFVARGDLKEVTPLMVALISATAVMLTMGLPPITYSTFQRILVYPTDYYSQINRQYHKGEVNMRHRLIILGWSHFVDGLKDRHDGINLGIHELAHALHLEDRIRNREHDFLHEGLLMHMQRQAYGEIRKILSGEDHLFRPYAAKNEEEFFAIALENFFERPLEFRDDLPHLYRIICGLLRQDPAERRILT